MLPFQSWKSFKESFAPELIDEAVRESPIAVRRLIDPFGGSGTSALAAQFMGIEPITAEVNPYLADLIESKLFRYDRSALRVDFDLLLRDLEQNDDPSERFLPPTFVEPGVKGRWLYSKHIARTIFQIVDAADRLPLEHARFFKVILSGIMLNFCNARVSGKGRRYRRNWEGLVFSRTELLATFAARAESALGELSQYGERACGTYVLHVGDSRVLQFEHKSAELAVFSPPYPNSFDYTDVYNIELWMLGYLSGWSDNRALRLRTLSSHVQVPRNFEKLSNASPTLDLVLNRLEEVRSQLWDERLPDMVAGYFSDLDAVIRSTNTALAPGGRVWMVVGDSRYADVTIPVAEVLSELTAGQGLRTIESRPFRSMRASPQQGGQPQLAETLLVLEKPFALPDRPSTS